MFAGRTNSDQGGESLTAHSQKLSDHSAKWASPPVARKRQTAMRAVRQAESSDEPYGKQLGVEPNRRTREGQNAFPRPRLLVTRSGHPAACTRGAFVAAETWALLKASNTEGAEGRLFVGSADRDFGSIDEAKPDSAKFRAVECRHRLDPDDRASVHAQEPVRVEA